MSSRIGLLVGIALLSASAAFAKPIEIHETQRIDLVTTNGSADLESWDVDFDTTGIIVGGRRGADYGAFMFERNAAGTWVFKQQLGVTQTAVWPRVAIGGKEAIYDIGELRMVHRGGYKWVPIQGPVFPYTRSWQSQIEYSGGRFYGSPISCELMIVGKAGGAWNYQGDLSFARQPYCNNNDQWHSIDGDRALVMTQNQARLYRRDSAGAWTPGEFLRRPDGNIAGGLNLSMSGSTATVEDDVYRAATPDAWQFVRHLQPLTAYQGGSGNTAVSGEFIMQWQWSDGLGDNTQSINIFRASDLEHVATLRTSDGGAMSGPFAFHGQYLVVTGRDTLEAAPNRLYYFELPTSYSPTPATVQDDFETGNAGGWTPFAGSQFTVATRPLAFGTRSTRVFRQSSVAGDAGAAFNAVDWTNQSITADVRPTAFSGSDRWAGLFARRSDASNYYYLSLRSSNKLLLRKKVNGGLVSLGSANIPVVLNRNYRLTLTASDGHVSAAVDGRTLIKVDDNELTSGSAGVLSYRAAADFDNVVVSGGSPIVMRHIETWNTGSYGWTATGTGEWWVSNQGYDRVLQNSTLTDARLITGIALARDQVIEAHVQADHYGIGTNPWFGVLGRYVNDGTYYYVSVRNSNALSLRKVVNGSITVLGTVPFTPTTSAPGDRLRLEIIGNKLRAYANGELAVESTDTQPIASGRFGLVTYRASAWFDNLNVFEP
jgi:hypothetical protein